MKLTSKTNILTFVLYCLFCFHAQAASGPLAKGFGADDWLDKIYVVFAVISLVIITTAILVFLILRKK